MKVNITYNFFHKEKLIYGFPKTNKKLWFLIVRSQNHIYYRVSENNKVHKLRKINEKFNGGIIPTKLNT